ncbi:uncharacterized protein LOC120496772 [Passer montanus]|uniref:uncharacterized protein LOC120496772 n=1 Tax=Passer montanus TaxID=9160 RepID=UPI00196054C2|nr:uncharacterized protein LOC120496772 [Passer montanus]
MFPPVPHFPSGMPGAQPLLLREGGALISPELGEMWGWAVTPLFSRSHRGVPQAGMFLALPSRLAAGFGCRDLGWHHPHVAQPRSPEELSKNPNQPVQADGAAGNSQEFVPQLPPGFDAQAWISQHWGVPILVFHVPTLDQARLSLCSSSLGLFFQEDPTAWSDEFALAAQDRCVGSMGRAACPCPAGMGSCGIHGKGSMSLSGWDCCVGSMGRAARPCPAGIAVWDPWEGQHVPLQLGLLCGFHGKGPISLSGWDGFLRDPWEGQESHQDLSPTLCSATGSPIPKLKALEDPPGFSLTFRDPDASLHCLSFPDFALS